MMVWLLTMIFLDGVGYDGIANSSQIAGKELFFVIAVSRKQQTDATDSQMALITTDE